MSAFSRKTPPFEYLQEINIKDPFALLSLYVYFKFNCLAKLFFFQYFASNNKTTMQVHFNSWRGVDHDNPEIINSLHFKGEEILYKPAK